MDYDAGKKMKDRKLHALVDTRGSPIRVVVRSAGLQGRDGVALALHKIRQSHPWLQLVWADSGYNAHQIVNAVATVPCLRLECYPLLLRDFAEKTSAIGGRQAGDREIPLGC